MTETFAAQSRRPLVLANRLRAEQRCLRMGVEPRVVAFDRAVFGGCTPVVLDAVSDWWDARGADKWPDDRLNPNYRSPWPNVWVEWEDKNESAVASIARGSAVGPVYKGALLTEFKLLPGQTPFDFLHESWSQLGGKPGDAPQPKGPDWHTAPYVGFFSLFGAFPDIDHICAFPPAIYPIHENGESAGLAAGTTDICCLGGTGPEVVGLVWGDFGMWKLFTALLRVRNLGVTDVMLPRAERRRAERAAIDDGGPPPWVRYKTLAITLPTKPNDRVGNATGGPASPVPFHLVRGHLADYRNGNGLFGKWKSVVWIPMHTRGFQKAGAIAKTYEAQMDIDADPEAI